MDNNNNIYNGQQPVQSVQPQPQVQPVQQPVQQPVYQQYPQYQQVPGQYVQYPVDPVFGSPLVSQEELEAKKANNKKGNILCFISIALQIVPYLTSGIIGALTEGLNSISDNYETISAITSILSTALGGSYFASWVLMIIARVKYKTTFSKVLMWVYIGMAALSVIAIILLFAMCAYMLKDCQGF